MVSVPFAPRPFDVQTVRAAFERAQPFRHVVIDDFFNVNDALALHHAFPSFSLESRIKARFFAGRFFGPPPDLSSTVFSTAFKELASRSFADSISQVSGIANLAMDETHSGAGVHVGLNGSVLAIHADHNTHPNAAWLFRRINILVYLNPNWNESWKANLLLYDDHGKQMQKEIQPRFNRAVIMDVHDTAFHGYHSLALPPGESRQALVAYFYSPSASAHQNRLPHGTILGKPTDLRLEQHLSARTKRLIRRVFTKFQPDPEWMPKP